MSHVKNEKFYRYEDKLEYSWDYEFEIVTSSIVVITLLEFDVIKHTPCGVWLSVYGTKKFVKTKARKRWACPTKKEAMESFLARKNKQKRLLEGQIDRVEKALYLAKIQMENEK